MPKSALSELPKPAEVRSIQKFFTHCPVSTFDRVPFQLTGELFLYGTALKSERNPLITPFGAGGAASVPGAFTRPRRRRDGRRGRRPAGRHARVRPRRPERAQPADAEGARGRRRSRLEASEADVRDARAAVPRGVRGKVRLASAFPSPRARPRVRRRPRGETRRESRSVGPLDRARWNRFRHPI